MAAGVLHSDHVNYLIFRYLQEHGHDDTARSFWRDWHRPRQYRDPEELPFAKDVTRFGLISIIQDGLRHDEMQSRIAGCRRRHAWSMVDPRKPVEGADDNTINGSRPSSSGKRKSIGTSVGAETYASSVKRQRVSSLPDIQTNGHRGDAMDVDARSSSAAEDEDIEDAISPAVASDTATDAPATRYDSVATQTEVINGQKIPPNRMRQHAMTMELNKGHAKILHAAWSPNNDVKTRNALFLSGESLCRLYRAPDRIDESTAITSIEHIDEPAISEGSMITAMTWHPAGRILTCAVDTKNESAEGKSTHAGRIISIGSDMGTYTHFPNLELLQPPGITLAMSYSPSGKYLMIVKTNMERAVIEIWPALDTKMSDMPSTQPLAWKIFEHSLSDAAWANEEQIIACTHTEQAWQLTLPATFTNTETFTEHSIAEYNIKSIAVHLPAQGEVDTTYRRDDTHAIDIFFVRPYDQSLSQDSMVLFDSSLYDTDAYLKGQKSFDLDWSFVAAGVQPLKQTSGVSDSISNHGPARLLAIIFEHGGCRLYELNRDADGVTCKPLFADNGYTLRMSYGSAIAMAWSPNGQYLAIAGKTLVQVWQLDAAAESVDKTPVLTWRASTPFLDGLEGINSAEQSTKPVSLTWDADSRRICYAVESKIAIIECEAVQTEPVANGDTS